MTKEGIRSTHWSQRAIELTRIDLILGDWVTNLQRNHIASDKMSINNNEALDEPTIGEFYAGKNIFVTGGTGFIGTVLIESLLSATPKIGTIYLLVREKYGSDTNERLKRLLSKQVRVGWKKNTPHLTYIENV